jgi:hypothetical protein
MTRSLFSFPFLWVVALTVSSAIPASEKSSSEHWAELFRSNLESMQGTLKVLNAPNASRNKSVWCLHLGRLVGKLSQLSALQAHGKAAEMADTLELYLALEKELAEEKKPQSSQEMPSPVLVEDKIVPWLTHIQKITAEVFPEKAQFEETVFGKYATAENSVDEQALQLKILGFLKKLEPSVDGLLKEFEVKTAPQKP